MTLTRSILFLSLIVSAAASAADKPGCADHPMFKTRMPGYSIEKCETKEFNAYDFRVPKGPKHRAEGRFVFITYVVDDRKNEPSGVEVVRNYENAIKNVGGTIIAVDARNWVSGKVVVEGKEVYVEAERGNGKIWLRTVETKAMEQHVVADAASFANDLKASGHASVPGIYFDTGKAVVKPESKPALEEVAKLLKNDAALKLWVVGHTDSVGTVEDNMKLSQARAEAVAAELVSAHGIAAARLKGFGAGPLAPVASNDSEDGRAKNRRVEVVKQP